MSNSVDRFFNPPDRDPGNDRRSMSRVVIEQFVEVSFDKEIFMQASAIDLSLGGLRVKTGDKLEPGARVFVMFRIPDEASKNLMISAECVVIHCVATDSDWTVGLRFHEISSNDRNQIKHMLDRNV